jgi:hypothetical protein
VPSSGRRTVCSLFVVACDRSFDFGDKFAQSFNILAEGIEALAGYISQMA